MKEFIALNDLLKSAVLKEYSMIINTITYPSADESVGEHLGEHEAETAQQIANLINEQAANRFTPGNFRREAHSKSHGCIKAEFRVLPTIPPELARGIFQPNAVYPAIIRYSNGSGNPNQADNHPDARGMAIKLFGIMQPTLLESPLNLHTQDFILLNHPFFMVNTAQQYLEFIKDAHGISVVDKMSVPFDLGLRGMIDAFKIGHGKIANPLQAQYYSAVPYQLGADAPKLVVKYSVKPVDSINPENTPEHPDPNYLREVLQSTLMQEAVDLKFMLQLRKEGMDVENAQVAWSEDASPFIEIATIHIPQQEFNTAAQNLECENLSFNPWHCTADHRPLGALNRIRKVVYEQASQFRHAENNPL